MFTYLILLNPGHNRVYFDSSKKLALAELGLCLHQLEVDHCNVAEVEICSVPYISFQTKLPLDNGALFSLAKLSFLYAMFEQKGESNEMSLIPIALPKAPYINDSISLILKYTGKTNELFTRMMIHVATLTLPRNTSHIKLLDPIAGKGTTLYEALIQGYDAYGVEIATKPVSEAYAYMKRYLETEKYKHTSHVEKISGNSKSFQAKRHAITLATNKEEFKSTPKHWEIVTGDSRHCNHYYKKNFFDMLVGDLPYGVQHGNVTNQPKGSFTRNPKELILACAPAWHTVLKPNGVLVLAWNSLLLHRNDFSYLLEQNGFSVCDSDAYLQFEHQVDSSIRRDIIVAMKR